MRKQPNVIVCIYDQLRAFEVGCYGNEVVCTPNIDRLAAAGVRFEHAVSNDPVCMSARSSLISGQYARTCMGALGNASEFDEQGRPVALAAARRGCADLAGVRRGGLRVAFHGCKSDVAPEGAPSHPLIRRL